MALAANAIVETVVAISAITCQSNAAILPGRYRGQKPKAMLLEETATADFRRTLVPRSYQEVRCNLDKAGAPKSDERLPAGYLRRFSARQLPELADSPHHDLAIVQPVSN